MLQIMLIMNLSTFQKLLEGTTEQDYHVFNRLVGEYPEVLDLASEFTDFEEYKALLKSSRIYNDAISRMVKDYSSIARLPEWLRQSISDKEAQDLDKRLSKLTKAYKHISETTESRRSEFKKNLRAELSDSIKIVNEVTTDLRIFILRLEVKDFLLKDILEYTKDLSNEKLVYKRSEDYSKATVSQRVAKERLLGRECADRIRKRYYFEVDSDSNLTNHLKGILRMIETSDLV